MANDIAYGVRQRPFFARVPPQKRMVIAKGDPLDFQQFLGRSPVSVIDTRQIGRGTFELDEPTYIVQQTTYVRLNRASSHGRNPLTEHSGEQRSLQRVDPEKTLRVGFREEHFDYSQSQYESGALLSDQAHDGSTPPDVFYPPSSRADNHGHRAARGADRQFQRPETAPEGAAVHHD